MSQSNYYSLASPTSLLLDDSQIIDRIFSHIDNKTTDLGSEVWREPVKNYVDQERFDREIKLLRSLPVPFCPSSALPNKGSYVSRIAAGTPILVTRDEENNVNAFINACRHRGMQVASGSGCKKSFICPYHGWTYGLKGENRNIPGSDGFPGVDPLEHGLKQINAVEKGGIVYVCQDGEIHKKFLDEALDYFTDEQALINQSEIEDQANWKILHETLLEGYHIKTLHKDTFFPYGLDNINVVENYGQNSRVIFPFRRIEKLRDVDPGSRVIDGTITSVYSLFPNASISVLSKHSNLVILEPISPSRSRWVIYTLINKSNKKGKLSKEDAMRDAKFVGNTGQDEDREAARAIQETLNTKANDHLIFGYFEKAIVNFHSHLTKYLDNQESAD
ncbi:Rieske 2Fe-2S domain-containing protein [Gammaproteobacteria bacterium]|jgi:phenylpropionate dioxygenase-like ring-hydroxylating dioxygenase large terminal subunit|nr:Rieske 2Fe-2S domain-containing protein [Gammaproteobacteria bacterium]